jgi:hypothetical protein
MLRQGPAAAGGGRHDLHLRVATKLGGVCPNCGGNFAPRPIRPANKLTKFPPSTQRVFKPQGCGQAA